jgi:predicted small secreted protein
MEMTLEVSGKIALITGIFAMFDPQEWVTLVTGAGLGTAIAVVLLHQLLKERNAANDQITKDRDEDRKRISALEKFQQETLLKLIQEGTTRQENTEEAMRESTSVIKENTKVAQECIHALSMLERKI